MSTVGFVGAGVMGAPMITNLVRNGHRVRAYGRSERSRDRIEQAGAEAVPGPAAVCDSADLVITMVPDTPDVAGLMLGDGELGRALSPDQVYVDMSTVAPSLSQEIATSLGDRGIGALDAPVSGGEQAAVDGALSVMIGGRDEDVELAEPVLDAVAGSITHVGPAGHGQLTKAANQLVVAINLQAVSEAIVFLESAGVAIGPALAAIGGGLAGSAVLDRRRAAFLDSEFTPGFRVTLHDKDLGIVASTARANGVALPVTAVVSQLMVALKAHGGADLDHSALLDLTRHLNRAIR